MEVKFNINIKTIKKAMALMGLDIPSNEEIEKSFSGVVVDISNPEDPDMERAELGFTIMAVGKVLENKNSNDVEI